MDTKNKEMNNQTAALYSNMSAVIYSSLFKILINSQLFFFQNSIKYKRFESFKLNVIEEITFVFERLPTHTSVILLYNSPVAERSPTTTAWLYMEAFFTTQAVQHLTITTITATKTIRITTATTITKI